MEHHIPVLLTETLETLNIEPNDIVLDGTMGFGGHGSEIVNKLATGKYIGLDRDPKAIKHCKELFKENKNVHIIQQDYANFPDVLEKLKFNKVSKILLDIGISSYQLDSAKRGFSFQKEEPLDMRMDPKSELTAEKILNQYSEELLTKVIFEYGEIRNYHKFIANVINMRTETPMLTTFDLVNMIKKSFYFRNKRSIYIRTCAQVFQALRIEVNQELNQLKGFLEHLESRLEIGARVAIITFHSLEDRIVKQYFKGKKYTFKPIEKKVIKAKQEEIRINSRAKSAKLRCVELIG
jgi:16S rRNA (cytosine1402-N4)-methyltransferase